MTMLSPPRPSKARAGVVMLSANRVSKTLLTRIRERFLRITFSLRKKTATEAGYSLVRIYAQLDDELHIKKTAEIRRSL
jgi:hypothetical protein